MRTFTAQVVDGKIEVGGELEEGAHVAVLALDSGSPQLSRGEEQELVAALAEIRAGQAIAGEALIEELKTTGS